MKLRFNTTHCYYLLHSFKALKVDELQTHSLPEVNVL